MTNITESWNHNNRTKGSWKSWNIHPECINVQVNKRPNQKYKAGLVPHTLPKQLGFINQINQNEIESEIEDTEHLHCIQDVLQIKLGVENQSHSIHQNWSRYPQTKAVANKWFPRMHRSTWRHSCSRCDTVWCVSLWICAPCHGDTWHPGACIEQYPSHTLEFPFLRTTHSLKQLPWIPAALQSNCSPSLLASSKSCRIEENAKKQKMNSRGNQKYLRIFFLFYLFIHFLLFLSLSSTMSQQNSAEQYLTASSLYL